MKTPKHYKSGYSESYSVGESSSESTGIFTGTGMSTSTSSSTSTAPTVAASDPWRHTRIHLQWNLEDLKSCLEHCDLTEDDFEWYVERATRIFRNSLQKKSGGGQTE